MPVRGGIANPREEEHENEDVRAHPACGGEEGSGKSEPRTAPKRNKKCGDVFAGRALKSHSSRRIEEGHDVLNTCVSRSSSRSWRCYVRPRPSWRRLRALPPPPPRVGPRRASYTHLTLYAFSYPPSGSPTSSPPIVVNCVWSAYTCGSCSLTCGTGTQTCTRTKTTQESNGGSCSGTASKTQDCNAQACVAPACPAVSSPTGYLKVTAKLTTKATATGSDTDAAFKAKVKTAIAVGGDTCENDVTIDAFAKSSNSAVVDATVRYPVDATVASKEAAIHKAVALMTKAMYMPNWVLPEQAHDASNTGAVVLDLASNTTQVTCPGAKTYAEAAASVTAKDYAGARAALNHIALCNYQTGSSALGTSSMADVCNLLGFSNRKLSNPDVKLSELYYKRSLQIKPNHVAANGYLGELYVQTNKPALAREVLDDLKAMCPPPAGCDSLTYLRDAMAAAKMEEGAHVRKLNWDQCFNLACSPLNLEKGDKIEFKYSASHDVVKVADKAAFDACAAGTTVGSSSQGAAGFVLDLNSVGTEHYVCGQGSHCANGQKIEVKVHERTYAAPPSSGGSAPCYSASCDSPAPAKPAPAKAGAAIAKPAFAALLATLAAALVS